MKAIKQVEKAEFRRLCQLEPQLLALYREAKQVKDDPTLPAFCANAVWYGYGQYQDRGLKRRLCRLVGWDAGQSEKPIGVLLTAQAYDVAYDVIYDALPNCRNCCCC